MCMSGSSHRQVLFRQAAGGLADEPRCGLGRPDAFRDRDPNGNALDWLDGMGVAAGAILVYAPVARTQPAGQDHA